MALTSEQIDAYRNDGVVVVPDALPKDDVGAWRLAWRALKQAMASANGRVQRRDRFVLGEMPPPLGDAYAHPALTDMARQMIGPDVALYFNRILVKDETWNAPVAAHQDCPYFHGSVDKLSVLVPLEPMNAERGGLSFVVGSHRFGNLGIRGTIRYEDFPPMRSVSPDVAPGDVILSPFTTWHRSERATVTCERPLLQIAYQPATDGSYYGAPDRPTLVCGVWRTDAFSRYRQGVQPDGVPPASPARPRRRRRGQRFFGWLSGRLG